MSERVFFSRLLEDLIGGLLNNRINDHVEKFDFFSDFQYGFRSTQ